MESAKYEYKIYIIFRGYVLLCLGYITRMYVYDILLTLDTF